MIQVLVVGGRASTLNQPVTYDFLGCFVTKLAQLMNIIPHKTADTQAAENISGRAKVSCKEDNGRSDSPVVNLIQAGNHNGFLLAAGAHFLHQILRLVQNKY